MKKLFRMLAIITIFKLLLLPAFSSQCLAQPRIGVQIGVTTDLLSNDKPATGVLGFEFGPARLTAGAGYDGRGEGAFDLIVRSRDGVYAGVGLFSEKSTEYETFTTSDTVTTSLPHPGKGKGVVRKKKSRKGGKVVVNSTYSFRGDDYASYPSAVLGVASKRTYFESRLIFGTNDTVSAQASFGFRW
jgi:hypothetical protein